MKSRRVERRNELRLGSALPVYLKNATGTMRDMSASGAYFWTRNKYSIGETIDFSIGIYTSEGRTAWKCRGDVLRTEHKGNNNGVAVKITSTTVEPPQRVRVRSTGIVRRPTASASRPQSR